MNLSLNSLDIQPMVVEKQGAQLDLFITLWKHEEGFNGYLEYSTLLFKENTAKRFTNIYQRIIKSYLENPGFLASDMDIVSEEEVRLISEWNNTDHESPLNEVFSRSLNNRYRKHLIQRRFFLAIPQ